MASTTATSASTSTGSEPITSTSQQSSTASSSNSPNNLNLYLQNDPARTGYNPSANFWLNYFNVLTGRMTREGAFHFRETVNRQNETRDVQRAEEYRDWNFRYSPVVTFLNDRIAELNHGQRMDASNVVCRRCPARLTPEGKVDRMSGGFEPTHGILICANEVRNRGHLEDVLAHEMVHAYDHLRFHADFRGEKDLRQAACTEIRASMLSGECRFTREFFLRQNWKLTEQFQDCVRKRAVLSMMGRPWVKDDVHATKIVNSVWDSCFADTRPFDEVYR